MKFQAIKGVRDILPPESALWNRVEQAARDVFRTYSYGEIRLPIFEPTELFARSVGLDTDIVSKEMYTFEDYESSELLEHRNAVVTWRESPNVPSPPGPLGVGPLAIFSPFTGLVSRFHMLAKEAFEKGQIPRTPENERVLSHLLGEREIFISSVQSVSVVQNLQAVNALKQLVRQVTLGDSLTLRPEATASVVRSYIEHGMQTWPSPVKLCYLGPMFRRERPQKGRYRQFYQIGAEVLGPNIADFAIDAEVISMLMSFFDRCGLHGHTLYINSIGDRNCRPIYVQRLQAELRKVREKLNADSQRRIETNPLRVLDSKEPREQDVIRNLPQIADHLCKECRDHFDGLQVALKRLGIKFEVNPRLVRGLDYYVRTTFEVTAQGQGSQNAICGGGRYDGLVELIGGSKFKDIKGVGFAIGEDRLIEALHHEDIRASSNVDVLVAWKEQGSRDHAEIIAQSLRQAGLIVEVPVKPMPPREGLALANKRGIPIGVVIGPDEVSAASFSVRLLSEGDQVSLTRAQVGQLGRLLKFRILLERELEQTAIAHGVEYKGVPLGKLAARLVEKGALAGHLQRPIAMAIDTFNRLVHGGEATEDQQSEAVAASMLVVNELAGQDAKARFRIG